VRRSDGGSRSNGHSRKRAAAGIAAALLVGLVVLLLLARDDGSDGGPASASQPTSSKSVTVVPESELLGAIRGVGYPVYWAGPEPSVEYEVSRLEGRTYVRYLPEGEKAESERPFLTVGSYEEPGALASIREEGQKPGAVLVRLSNDGVAYAESADATNAYLAFPGIGIQIEVFDPRGGRALNLIRAGEVVPVGAG
jgi:hypothetical protein